MLNKIVFFIARLTFGSYLARRYKVSFEYPAELAKLPGPYILIANHVTNLDPFIYNIPLKDNVSWVLGASIIRSKAIRPLIKAVRGIVASRRPGSMKAIKSMMDNKAAAGVIGLFAEGKTTRGGSTELIDVNIAKIVKLLKIPVVLARNRLGYFWKPRWSINSAKAGVMPIEYSLALSAEQVKTKSVDEVLGIINSKLANNAYEELELYNNKHPQAPLSFSSPSLAENLELILYTCPSCLSIRSLTSKKDQLFCTECGTTWSLDSSYSFQAKAPQKNILTWLTWQDTYLSKTLVPAYLNSTTEAQEPLLFNEAVKIYSEKEGEEELLLAASGTISLVYDTIILDLGKRELHLSIRDIKIIHVFKHNQLEFIYGDLIYFFNFNSLKVSAFAWLDILNIIKIELEKKNS